MCIVGWCFKPFVSVLTNPYIDSCDGRRGCSVSAAGGSCWADDEPRCSAAAAPAGLPAARGVQGKEV